MSKRSLSPQPLPPSKRIHTSASHHISAPAQTFDSLLYDELILTIFSFLPFQDLCTIQATNRNWARLALDNQVHILPSLWKTLYREEFGRARLRGGKGFGREHRKDGREVRRLPGRFQLKHPGTQTDDFKEWKWMFRISRNWATGRCEISQLHDEVPVDHLTLTPQEREIAGRTHIVLSGHYTIFASSETSPLPRVTVLNTSAQETHTLDIPGSNRPAAARLQITALAVDQSPPAASSRSPRLVVCLSNGELVITTLSGPTSSYVPAARTARVTPIVQAAYHHPLLVTLSSSFTLSAYKVAEDGFINLSHILTSFSSFPPASLVLTTPEPLLFKLVLTYASPVYPQHWSIGVTEALFSTVPPSESSTYSEDDIKLVSTRSSKAFDLPPSWIDEEKLRAVREQWGRKVARVAATQTDGRWVVLAPGRDVPARPIPADLLPHFQRAWLFGSVPLQLYRLSFPALPAPPKLTFVKFLYGQTSEAVGLAVADGRCVSLGANGRMWVWDLEAGGGSEVACEQWGGSGPDTLVAKGSVVFDDRRIVSARAGSVTVSNFDV
ncbi:hypothetical protein FA95DRAFT_1535097 [Auriscalpium vulgare]|uniref:Uncharacterized protein n=1 Tax=Auriscalpium vulgare TaxID=40419 RepID=A0ACB8S516_9AGAM|nr:hypothetical protein FA95DRAFT_1535097 [Auriscalpium vulgare]